MFHLPVRSEVRHYAQSLLRGRGFGNRGRADGTPEQQLTGLIGQTLVHDLFRVPRPVDLGRSDRGVDFVLHGVTIDVKTMGRRHAPLPEYTNNYQAIQRVATADVILFCSHNRTVDVLTVCGWMPGPELFEKATFRPAGSQFTRQDGTTFTGRDDLYVIANGDLRPAKSLRQLDAVLREFAAARSDCLYAKATLC